MADSRFAALVPMKHHSERVPGKNYRPLAGKPLFYWVLDALNASDHVGEILINTDSEEIAGEAPKHFDVQVLWRPDELLGDMVPMQPLIAHDIEFTERNLFLQTHSTNPFLTSSTIDAAIEAYLEDDEYDSLFSVTPLHTRLYWPDGRPINHDPEVLLRTQDLPPILEENSCIYLFSRETFQRTGHRLGQRPAMFEMDALEAVDIDEEHDFRIAEALAAGGRLGR